jgi:hypothetical protein
VLSNVHGRPPPASWPGPPPAPWATVQQAGRRSGGRRDRPSLLRPARQATAAPPRRPTTLVTTVLNRIPGSCWHSRERSRGQPKVVVSSATNPGGQRIRRRPDGLIWMTSPSRQNGNQRAPSRRSVAWRPDAPVTKGLVASSRKRPRKRCSRRRLAWSGGVADQRQAQDRPLWRPGCRRAPGHAPCAGQHGQGNGRPCGAAYYLPRSASSLSRFSSFGSCLRD